MYVNNLYLRKIRELFKIKNDSKEKVERYVQKVREEWVEENMIDFYFFGQPDLDYLVRYYLACQAYVNKIMYEKVVTNLRKRLKNGCTACRYCMPCPFGVDIPGNFAIWNQYGMYDNKETFKNRVNHFIKNDKFADKCVKCGRCETLCPQHITIRDDLEHIIKDYNNIQYNN